MGSLSILLSCIFYSIMALLIKPLSSDFNGLFISGFRFLIGIGLGFFVLYISKKQFKIIDKKSWILRGVFGAISMIAYFVAVQFTSSGRATLLSNTYPIFVALFGGLFFGERLSVKNIASLFLCIIGIVFVFYDRNLYPIWGDILGLISGITGGIAIQYLKKSREYNNSIVIYLSACFFGILALPFSINQPLHFSMYTVGMLMAIGIFAFAGQILMTYGFKTVSATKGSILSYAGIPMTLMLSYWFLGEPMHAKFLVGIGFILAGLIMDAVNVE